MGYIYILEAELIGLTETYKKQLEDVKRLEEEIKQDEANGLEVSLEKIEELNEKRSELLAIEKEGEKITEKIANNVATIGDETRKTAKVVRDYHKSNYLVAIGKDN